jgi:hypothetical protein
MFQGIFSPGMLERYVTMEIVYFTFKDEWFDLSTFPLHTIMHRYNKHDGSMGKHVANWNWYLDNLR